MTVRLRLPAPGSSDVVLLSLTDKEDDRVTGPGEQSVTFEPMSELQADLLIQDEGSTDDLQVGPNKAKWDIRATFPGYWKTLASGLADVLEDQTRPEA
jgi:hypothetical protein